MASNTERLRFIIDNRYYSLEANGTSVEVMTEQLKKEFGRAVEIVEVPVLEGSDETDGK